MTRTPNNDEPDIDVNLLPERQRLLNKLVQDIRQCTPPMVFGVHGDWGAGKTSFLQAVMHALTGSCPSKPESPRSERRNHPEWKDAPLAVWFESWRYQNEASPVVALLHELRDQLRWFTHPVAKGGQKIKETALTLWNTLFLSLDSINATIEGEMDAGVGSVKAGISFNPFPISKARDEVAKTRLSTPLPSNQIRNALDEIFGQLLGMKLGERSAKARIVIFIDDLDRCSAAAMFSLLESIKIYLNLRHCVFVLGINRHELERNIASVLPEPIVADQRQVRAHEYIEKLCGNVIRLPYPNPASQPKLVDKWLGTLDDPGREELVRLVNAHAFLPLNPRRIKMWCNTAIQLYDNRVAVLGAAPDVAELAALALVASLHTFYPVLHQSLATAPSFIMSLKKWCDATQRIEPDLDVFDCLLRVFVMPPFITSASKAEFEAVADYQNAHHRTENLQKLEAARSARLESLNPILKRAYGWAGDLDPAEDQAAEPAQPQRIPLLTDPSSLQYFHPQRLVADETISEAHIILYLLLN